jgi:hypothetical protein
VTIEGNGLIVLGMDGKRTHADYIGNLQRASQCVEQKREPLYGILVALALAGFHPVPTLLFISVRLGPF